MLLFIIVALFLIYFASLGTGYSQLFTELMIPAFILVILVYMFEGAPEGNNPTAVGLKRRLRKWGNRSILGCIVGWFCLLLGPTLDLPKVKLTTGYAIGGGTISPIPIGIIVAGISFFGFTIYWMHISDLAEAIPVSQPASSTDVGPARNPQ
jgi:hypothetical protein